MKLQTTQRSISASVDANLATQNASPIQVAVASLTSGLDGLCQAAEELPGRFLSLAHVPAGGNEHSLSL